MRTGLLEDYRERGAIVSAQALDGRSIDPLAYSSDFEERFGSELSIFQSLLDFAAQRCSSSRSRRRLTKLEHKRLAQSQIAYEISRRLEATKHSDVAGTILLSGGMQAVALATGNHTATIRFVRRLLERLHLPFERIHAVTLHKPWHLLSNIEQLLDVSDPEHPKLKSGLIEQKLLYAVQMCVHTCEPGSADEYPESSIVKPAEFFARTEMCVNREDLWTHEIQVTSSGKLIVERLPRQNLGAGRRPVGVIADLHLKLAEFILAELSHHHISSETPPESVEPPSLFFD